MSTPFNWETIIQGLGGRRAGTLPSSAPGTGPTEHDSQTTPPKPTFLGGNPIPSTKPQTDTGYGGTGDPTPPNAASHIEPRPLAPTILGDKRPRFNSLYGPLRTEGDTWRFVNRGYASGTWTPVSGTQAAIAVTLTQANQIPTKLYQWADAISMYWVIQYFSFAPVASTMTGSQSITFQPNNGDNQVPLGVYGGGVLSAQFSGPVLLDAPATDPTAATIGNLYVTGNTIATAAVCAWQMGIGIAYLLPPPLFGMYTSDAAASADASSARRYPTGRGRR